MGMDKIIDDLYEILDTSWHLPLSGGKVILDSKEIRCLLEDIRLKMPKEIVQAKSIVEDSSKIIDDAKKEAARIVKLSEEKFHSMIEQSEIVKNAQMTANKIISDAKSDSKKIKAAANQYVDNLMKDAEQIVAAQMAEIKKARQALRSSERKGD